MSMAEDQQRIRTVTDYQNELLDLYNSTEVEGEEEKGGHSLNGTFTKDWKKTSHPASCLSFGSVLTHLSISGTSFHIRFVISKTESS